MKPSPRLCPFRSTALCLLLAAVALKAENVQSNYWYQSTVSTDANGPLDLLAELNYDNSRSNAPIAVVMHGYSVGQGVANVRDQTQRLRNNGFFAISVAMRGRDGSDGVRDSGGVEIHDIYDAVEAVKADPAFSGFIDPGNVHITGYSGGGGNTMSALTKFPDYFRLGSAYFGMSDYGHDLANGWYNNGAGARTSQLNIDIGNPNTGGPAVRDRYLARASNLASKNNPYSEIHLFVNHDETICPPWNNTSYRDNAVAAESFPGEFANITVHIGGLGVYQDFNNNSINDANELQDWPHGVPNANRQDAAELWYRDRLLAGSIPQPTLNDSDELRVAGYVKTSKFDLWLGDRQNAAADLTYSLSGTHKTFSFQIASSDHSVTGNLTVNTADMADRRIIVKLDNVEVASFSGGGSHTHSGLGHNQTLELIDDGPSNNQAPTLTSFAAPVATTAENTEVEITFDALAAQGDQADSDGTVEAFVVKAIVSGTLRLGADAASATPFVAATNDTINAATRAYWTPATGAGIDAFTVVARDSDLSESSPAVAVPVEVLATGAPNGLIAYYNFEDDTLDSSGNGNHGTNNGVIFSTDVPAALSHSTKSGSFDGGTSGDHVDLGHLELFELARTLGVTISFWVKPAIASQNAWVIAEGNNTNANTAYVWGTRTAGDGKAHNFIRNDNLSVNKTAASSGNAFLVGQWHHVLITDNAGTVSLYIDGVLDANSSALSYSPTGTFTLQNTSIGAWRRGATGGPTISNQFNGLIDDVAIYNRILNSGEIAALAAGESPLPGVGNNYADWIAGFPGVNGQTGLGDDPDGDGIPNGVENYFGTNPGEFSQGLLAVGYDEATNTFTFTHPLSATPADDLTATYRWSTDLQTFYDDGATDADGTTVTFTPQADTPSPGITTVTAALTGTATGKLFVRVEVSQH